MKIKFKMELEQEGFIPFLDVGITKSEGTLITRVYRKPTQPQQYINWASNHPRDMLLGVLKRANSSSSCIMRFERASLEELALLRHVFFSNGYPEKLVVKTLEELWATEMLEAVLIGIEQEARAEGKKEYFEVLHAPYVKAFSEGLGRKLTRLGIGFVPKKVEIEFWRRGKM